MSGRVTVPSIFMIPVNSVLFVLFLKRRIRVMVLVPLRSIRRWCRRVAVVPLLVPVISVRRLMTFNLIVLFLMVLTWLIQWSQIVGRGRTFEVTNLVHRLSPIVTVNSLFLLLVFIAVKLITLLLTFSFILKLPLFHKFTLLFKFLLFIL